MKDRNAKIIIVDDHELFREGIKLLIEKEGMGEVVAEAENGEEFLDLLKEHTPDLVLMDIEMPVLDGVVATIKARVIRPGLKILGLTMLEEKENYVAMINAGAMGFVKKSSGKQVLQKAIRTVIGGEFYFSNELLYQIVVNSNKPISGCLQPDDNTVAFTEKELEILQYCCKGLSSGEIAARLSKSIKTIEAKRSRLMEKTKTKNTINLVLYAIRNKLVEI